MIKLCIATGHFYQPQETQINFHIQNLFGGASAILCENPFHDDPFGKPYMAWMPPKPTNPTLSEKLTQLRQKVHNLRTYRTARVPHGAGRNKVEAFLRNNQIDVVLGEFGNTSMRVAPVVHAMGIPMFSYFRGADASSQLQVPFRAAAYGRMMGQLDGVFAVAQFLFDELAARGVKHPNSHVVPSGVNTDLFLPGDKRPTSFLAVGRFVEKKRPDITVTAFCKAAQDNPTARLEMIGDGPLLEQCQALAKSHGMSDRVIFHGAKPHAFVREKLAETEIFLQHSVVAKNKNTEGLPTAIQEAMSAGMMIISTRHAGIPEAVIEGENGFLVDEHDADGFLSCIRKALGSPDQTPVIGARNRVKAQESYDNRKLIKKVEREITAVVERRRAVATTP
ncbi:glycosyltransferase [Cognatiyoonia sp. IB215446]|uniref:glycosyltransferase n=1 Tax=Cognatiyoonia sp. IB215446 TaxID=3097355 RepID=UPI002A0D6B10|nr:glycosyltransferase [Cognatiyoonia sp. IB215446]MDX8348013.1 glycosyltransferase [Cognatiyoonia sp. IB215446]